MLKYESAFELIDQARLLGGLATALENLRQATACLDRVAGQLDSSCKALALAMHDRIDAAEDDSL